MTWHGGEITCMAACVHGDEPGPDLVATADRLGAPGIWRGGAARALVWNGLTGRLLACVPGRDGDEVLGPVVAVCFCPAPARLGRGSGAGSVGLVTVMCDGALGYGVRVYSVAHAAQARAGGPVQADGTVAVASVCWAGWARCTMVHAVAATGLGDGKSGEQELCIVTAGKRHVR